MRLKGRTVYITGGTGGLGRPVVRLLEKEGAIVHLHDRSKDGDLAENIDAFCKRLAANPPDILVNMAGINELDWCENQNAEEIIRINLLAPVRLIQAVLPGMKKRGSGHIVNVGSMTGLIPLPYYSCYVATKAGLKGFNDALRRELYDSGIVLTHIAPRAVQTNMNEGAIADFNRQTHVYVDKADKIAARILRAILTQEKDVRIGWPERLYAFVSFLLPGVIDKGLEAHRVAGSEVITEYKNKEKKDEENTAA